MGQKHIIMQPDFLSADYWNERYLAGQTGWDLGAVSIPLKAYFDQLEDKHLAILIPGGGNSYEAEYLLQQGFDNITVVDISSVVTDKLKNKFLPYGDKIQVVCDDFFALKGCYDLIIEQTFVSAIDPSLRGQYVETCFRLLKPNGKVTGVLFNKHFPENPPFGGSIDEYCAMFSKRFHIKTLEECYNSIPPRMGTEVFFISERKSVNSDQ